MASTSWNDHGCISVSTLDTLVEHDVLGIVLFDIGAVRVSKPVFALNNAGHCGELSLAPTSILEHD